MKGSIRRHGGQYIDRLPQALRPTLRRLFTGKDAPSQCEVCRSWGNSRVCGDCQTRLARRVVRCGRCALPAAGTARACGTCLRSPPPFAAAVCAVDYAFPWDRMILDLKFHRRVELSKPLGATLVAALHAQDAGRGVELVLPVPLSPARLAERGYNQAWEIARRVAGNLQLPAHAGWLQRPIDGAHQADLPRDARANNLRGAFMVHPQDQPRIAGLHIALVDDVMTTGATAREATAALLRAGAVSVVVWAVARTP